MRIGASRQKYSPWLVVHFGRTEIITPESGGGGGGDGTTTAQLSCSATFYTGEITVTWLGSAYMGSAPPLVSGNQQYAFINTRGRASWPNDGGAIVLKNESASWSLVVKLSRFNPSTNGYNDNFVDHKMSTSYDGLHTVLGGEGVSSTSSNTPSGVLSPGWWTYDCVSGTWSANVKKIIYPFIPDYGYITNPEEFTGAMPETDFYLSPVMSRDGKSFIVASIYNGNVTSAIAGSLFSYSRGDYSSSWSLASTNLLNFTSIVGEMGSLVAGVAGLLPAVRVLLLDSFYKEDSLIWVQANWVESVDFPPFSPALVNRSAIVAYELNNSSWAVSSTLPKFISKTLLDVEGVIENSGNDRYVTKRNNRSTAFVSKQNNNWYITRSMDTTYDDNSLSAGALIIYKIKDGSWTATQTLRPAPETLLEYSYFSNSITFSAIPVANFGFSVAITHDMKYMATTQLQYTNQISTSTSYYNTSSKLIYLYERVNGLWKEIGRNKTKQDIVDIQRTELGLTDTSVMIGAYNFNPGIIQGALMYTGYLTVCN